MKITVLGSGAWGTALALLLLENGNDVTLWSYTEEESAVLREKRENPMLKGVPLPEELKLTTDMAAVKGCGERGIPCTMLRPAILYGPYNYAPRESVYIQMLLQNHALPRFTDGDGRFQFVYVKDAACAVLNCLGEEKTYGQAYNLCQDQVITYEVFFAALKRAAEPEDLEGLTEVPLTVAGAVAQGVPVPFPATAQETHLCDNAKGKRELGMEYLSFEEGMGRTYRAFRNVYLPGKC